MKHTPTDSHTDTARRDRFYAEIWPEAAMLMRTAISLMPGPGKTAEAEDLVQETLLKAFKSIDQLESGSHPRAWLLTMLRRTWIDRWRKTERRPDGNAADLDSVAEPAVEVQVGEHDEDWTDPQSLLSRFGDQDIIKALQLLPEAYRWALLLVDVQGLSVEEAAHALDVAAGTIKSRLHRGRAMLRDQLHYYASERGWLGTDGNTKAEETTHD
jgi:RNA polymerase sigma-70 factor (ECF subfamily)